MVSLNAINSQKRYETEIANLNALRKRERIIWVSVITALMLIVIALAIYRRYRYTKEESRRLEMEIEQLRQKHSQAIEENGKLLSETENLLSAKEQVLSKLESERREKSKLQMALILTEEEHKRLLAEKEEARKAMEAAEEALEKERQDLEYYRREKEVAVAKLTREREEFEAQFREMENQTARFNELLGQKDDLAPEVKRAIHARLGLLHGMLASQINNDQKLAEKMSALKERIIEDKAAFIDETRLAYKAANPKFIAFLEARGLTEKEIGCACLYIIGLNGKEIATFLGDRRHYHMSSDIRRKLDLPEKSNNLGPRLRHFYKHYLEA